jgi:hypothetical protein
VRSRGSDVALHSGCRCFEALRQPLPRAEPDQRIEEVKPMTGKWLGQQPLKQQTLKQQTLEQRTLRQQHLRQRPTQRATTLRASVLGCWLLACGGCVDMVARTAGLPIAGGAPPEESVSTDRAGLPEEGVAVAGDGSSDTTTPGNDTSAYDKGSTKTATDSAAAGSSMSGPPSFDPPSFDPPSTVTPSSVESRGATPAAGSADGFPDAGEVGLAHRSAAG